MVRAKFKVTGKTEQADGGGTVNLWPVTTGSPENEEFYRYTPGGSIMLSTINGAAFEQFEVDKEYYVDFTPAG